MPPMQTTKSQEKFMTQEDPLGQAPIPSPDPKDPNNPLVRLVGRIDRDPRVKEALLVAIRKAKERERNQP